MMSGRPHVKIVLIIKFARKARTNEVTGNAELYVCDASGNSFCQQEAASSPEATTKCRPLCQYRGIHRLEKRASSIVVGSTSTEGHYKPVKHSFCSPGKHIERVTLAINTMSTNNIHRCPWPVSGQ